MAEIAQRTSGLVQIIGVNGAAPSVKSLKAPETPKLEDTTDQAFAQAQQNIEKMYQSTLSGMEATSKARAAELQSSGRSSVGSELQALGETIISGVGMIREDQAKRKDAKDKALQSQTNLVTRSAVQEQILQLETRIQQTSDEEGINTTSYEINRILAENAANLSPEDNEAIRDMVVSQLDQARQRQTTRVWNTQEQLANQRKAAVQSRVQWQTSEIVQRVSTSRSAQDVQRGLLEAQQIIANDPELTDEEKAASMTAVLAELAKARGTSAEARQAAIQGGADITAAFAAVEEARKQHGNNPVAFAYAKEQIAIQYPSARAFIGQQPDNLGLMQQTVQYNESAQKLSDAARITEDDRLAREQGNYTSLAAATLAYQWRTGGQARMALVRSQGAKASIVERTALEIYDSSEKKSQEYQQRQREYLELNTQIEAAYTKADPSRLGADTFERVTDPLTGQFKGFQRVSGGGLMLRPDITPQGINTLIEQQRLLEAQMNQDAADMAQQGFNISDLSDGRYQADLAKRLQASQAMADAAATFEGSAAGGAAGVAQPGGLPNFSQADGKGRIPSQPIVPLSRMINGNAGDADLNIVSPFSGANAVFTDGYGHGSDHETGNQKHGGRFHSGIDIGSDESGDVPTRAISGGTVIHAENWGDAGFGGTVTIRTPDGHVEQYSHLRSFDVKPGQQLAPGTAIGLMGGGAGDAMAGSSSGRHVHFTVYRQGLGDGDIGYSLEANTIDPVEYLASRQYGGTPNNGMSTGSPPSQATTVHTDAPINPYLLPAPGSYMLTNGQIQDLTAPFGSGDIVIRPNLSGVGGGNIQVPLSNIATPATPVMNGMSPIAKQNYDLRPNPQANYGYEQLRNDKEARASIAWASQQLGVPGQWLADIIAWETGHKFSAATQNQFGFTGLIQFDPDLWFPFFGVSEQEVLNMTFDEQMRRMVVPYFKQIQSESGKGYETVEDLYSAVLGGSPLHSQSPGQRGDFVDGNNGSFASYMQRLGNGAGRRYRTTWDRANDASSPTQRVAQGQDPPRAGGWSR